MAQSVIAFGSDPYMRPFLPAEVRRRILVLPTYEKNNW